MFSDIDKVCDFAMRRRVDLLGHTLCQEDKKLAKKLLTCWLQRPIACGGQQLTPKDMNFNVINLLLESKNFEMEKNCPTAAWAKEALNPTNRKSLGKERRYIRPKQKRETKRRAQQQRTNH
jgi:hypothetical protein